MASVAYMPGFLRNQLSILKVVEQWGKPLIYYKTKAVLGFPRKESLVFNFCPRKRLFFATGVKRIQRQGGALAVAAKARNIMEVHRKLAHPGEEITQQTTEAIGTVTTGW